jgi:hypothetical protein
MWQDLEHGAGAAWNARARFPAASTLKLAVGVEVLRTLDGKPQHGSTVDSMLNAMLVRSDNLAANQLEAYVGGSVHGGSARVDALMRSVGLFDSEMYGGLPARHRRLAADSRPGERAAVVRERQVHDRATLPGCWRSSTWRVTARALWPSDIAGSSRLRTPATSSTSWHTPATTASLTAWRRAAWPSCTRPAGSPPHVTMRASSIGEEAASWRR